MSDTGVLRILCMMENARTEVADTAMAYYWSVHDGAGSDYPQHLHDRLMRACETYAVARDMVIEP